MKKLRLIAVAAVLMVASAVNFGILSNSIGVNVAYGCEGGNWAYGPAKCPSGGWGCLILYQPEVGCDPSDPAWDC